MLQADRPADQALCRLLAGHPRVELSSTPSDEGVLVFRESGKERRVFFGGTGGEIVGLVETMDNNPMVCAGSVRVPTADSTLALIALSPLVRAGLVCDEPAVAFSFEPGCSDLEEQMALVGLVGPVAAHVDVQDLGTVFSANVMAEIPGGIGPDDVADLFFESYGRSFFVRSFIGAEWDTELVAGKPWAATRLRITPGEGNSLVTVQVMADRDGKCGAAQVVHAMNVMCGFEESLGLEP